jgi:hypothetical protein
VIPSLKLSDKGLFDGENFQFTSLQCSWNKSFNSLYLDIINHYLRDTLPRDNIFEKSLLMY